MIRKLARRLVPQLIRELIQILNQNIKAKRFFSKKGSSIGFSFIALKINNLDISEGVKVERGARIESFSHYGGKDMNPEFVIEENVYIGPRFTALVADRLLIKKNVMLAENVSLITEDHGVDAEGSLGYGQQPLETGPITIGEGAWLGQNVTVLRGVEIGERSIVAAGSVVTKSIPAFCIAAGVPAKVIKRWNAKEKMWVKPKA